jgi:hypothetical protein
MPALPMQTLPSLCIALDRAETLAVRGAFEFGLYLPLVALGYFSVGIPGVIGAKFLSLFVSATISMFLVRSLLNLSIRQQLSDLIESAIATVVLGLVLTLLTTAIQEPTGRIALIAYICGIGGAGLVIYALAAIALWNRMGRRDGVERVAANILLGLGRRAKLIGASRA